MKRLHTVAMTPGEVQLDGATVCRAANGDDIATTLYRSEGTAYPKFFKMDPLCRRAFMAAELLVEAARSENPELKLDDCAVILFNSLASLETDRKYEQTVSGGEFFPSPALFVYTLPNIATGEIAIRHKMYGETSHYVVESYSDLAARRLVEASLEEGKTVIWGYADFPLQMHISAT